MPKARVASRQRHVDRLAARRAFYRRRLQRRTALADQRLQLLLDDVDLRAGRRPLLRRQGRQPFSSAVSAPFLPR
jgi:hypothetical protein